MRISIAVYLLVSFANLLTGQDLVKIYDLGFHQVNGDKIIEQNQKIYMTGTAMDTTLPQAIEWNLHLTSFDLHGKPLQTLFWNNLDVEDEIIDMNSRNFFVHDDNFIIPYTSTDIDCVLRADTTMTSIEAIECGSEFRVTNHSLEWPQDHLVTFIGGSDFKLKLGQLALEDQEEMQIIDISPNPDFEYYPTKIFNISEKELLLLGTYFLRTSSFAENKTGLFLITVDEDYNIIAEAYIEDDIETQPMLSDCIIDSEGALICSAQRRDREKYNTSGRSETYTVLFKIDTSSWVVEWEIPAYDTIYYRDPDFINEIVESHDEDGYLIYGNVNDKANRHKYVSYGKVSKSGEKIWQDTIADLQLNNLFAKNLIATKDGYYMATFDRDDRTPGDGHDTRVQVGMFKFDEDGRLLATSQVSESEENKFPLSIYPNPVQDLLLIDFSYHHSVNVTLANVEGLKVKSLEGVRGKCEIDVSGLVQGSYILLVTDIEDNILAQEKVILID